jgi:hypothetical protein
MTKESTYDTLNYDTLTAVQDKVLEAIRVGQEATLTAVRETAEAFTTAVPRVPEWAEAFTSALPKPPEWAEAYVPKVPDFSVLPSFQTVIGFTEKVWEAQRQFNLKLYEAIAPIGTSTFAAAKETVKATTKPVPDQAKPAAEHTPRAAASASAKA